MQATGSVKGATLMEAAIVIIAFLATFATFASVSRLTWAFARDGGLPFCRFFAHVFSGHHKACLYLLTLLGKPALPRPHPRNRSRNRRRYLIISSQHWFLHRPQCHPLAFYLGPLHILPYPHLNLRRQALETRTHLLRPLPPRKIRSLDQHLVYNLRS